MSTMIKIICIFFKVIFVISIHVLKIIAQIEMCTECFFFFAVVTLRILRNSDDNTCIWINEIRLHIVAI